MIMNEYDFMDYCATEYTNGLSQSDSLAFYNLDSWEQSELIKSIPAWQLVVWLGEFLTNQ